VLVEDGDEVMLISTGGVLIRTGVAQIREQGRSTQGVTLIALGEGEKLAGVERIEEHDEVEAGNGHGGAGDNGRGDGNGGNGGNGGNDGNGDDGEMPVAQDPGPTVH
jgi:DNA gyrase subunit A